MSWSCKPPCQCTHVFSQQQHKQQHMCIFTAAADAAAIALFTLSGRSSSSNDSDDINEGHMYNTCMSCVS